MKELSIEEKAKAYDEVRKKIAIRFGSNVAEEIFSQFEMSEDERVIRFISNELLRLMNACENGDLRYGELTNAVAWLEKQGEQKLTPIFRIGDTIIAKDGTYIEKEPFHIDRIEDDCYWDGENTILVCNQDEFEIFEQKSAEWNIFDYRTWQYIVSDVLTKKDGIGQYLDNGECKKIAKYMQEEWSKKLSTKQKSAAWSEEDEKFVHGLIRGLAAKRDIHGHTTFSSDCIDITETINWLKSLRPQNRWKPSKKQLEALEHSLGDYNIKIFEDRYEILKSLYQDLKKLKESK